MATPTPAPMTRFLRLSREAASVRKSSSPLAGMVVPARLNSGTKKVTTGRRREGSELVGQREKEVEMCDSLDQDRLGFFFLVFFKELGIIIQSSQEWWQI